MSVFRLYRYVYDTRKLPDLARKSIFISGCDSGFGKAIAVKLDSLGLHVFAGCLTQDGAQQLKQETSTKLKTMPLDITSSESITNAFNFIKANLSTDSDFWGLVNNAGISRLGEIEFVTIPDFEESMKVNFIGHVEMTKTFLPLLKKSKGRIVNIVTMSTKLIGQSNSSYIASKCALLGLSESLRREKAPWGIHVSAVLPGTYKTEIVNMDTIEVYMRKRWEDAPDDIKQEYGAEYIEDSINFYRDFFSSASGDLSPVVECVEHGLFARQPKSVYYAASYSALLVFISWFPRILDLVNRKCIEM